MYQLSTSRQTCLPVNTRATALSRTLAASSLPVLPSVRINRESKGIADSFLPLVTDRARLTQHWPRAYWGRLALLPCW